MAWHPGCLHGPDHDLEGRICKVCGLIFDLHRPRSYWGRAKSKDTWQVLYRRKITAPHMVALLQRDGPYCTYCGIEFDYLNPPTRDHLLPLVRGGKSTMDNLKLACQSCNTKKSGRTEEEYRAKLSGTVVL